MRDRTEPKSFHQGLRYLRGHHGYRNLPQARACFAQAVSEGSGKAIVHLAAMIERGQGGSSDPLEFSRVLMSAADNGAAEAQFHCGNSFLEHGDTNNNLAIARKYFSSAAVTGHIRAQYELGQMMLAGQGGPIDRVAARCWFNISARKGYVPSMIMASAMARDGTGGRQNYPSAREWLGRAAALCGHAEIQYSYANMLLEGQGGPIDLQTAFKLHRRAADQGHADARIVSAVIDLWLAEHGGITGAEQFLNRSANKNIAGCTGEQAKSSAAGRLRSIVSTSTKPTKFIPRKTL